MRCNKPYSCCASVENRLEESIIRAETTARRWGGRTQTAPNGQASGPQRSRVGVVEFRQRAADLEALALQPLALHLAGAAHRLSGLARPAL